MALIVDNFAGGGGASLGMEMASWRAPDIAINHDPVALGLHEANHPHTRHVVEDVFAVDPREETKGHPVALAWFSPDCKHFSKAKGGKPVDKRIRGLAWVVIKWAVRVKPAVIMLENVEEFQDWAPLAADGRPCPDRKGQTFQLFVHRLRQAGYEVEWRELRACDYGAPTIRKRLFLIARRDEKPIRWPQPTHADPTSLDVALGLKKPWRTAAEVIDWSLPCPSIFERKRPLAEATMRRIARGLQRFVLHAAEPFIISVAHGDSGGRREYPLAEPLGTVSAGGGQHALVAPYFAPRYQEKPGDQPRVRSIDLPAATVVAGGNAPGALIAPVLTYGQQGGGNRSIQEPHHTITTSTKDTNCLVAATIERQFGNSAGNGIDEPLGTVTAGGGGKSALVAAFLAQHNTGVTGHDARKPLSTLTGRGTQQNVVSAFLMKYYGTGGQHQDCREPMHTIPTKARLGLVTVAGIEYQIVDIGMRMLTPRELFRAQGFPDSYIIDRQADGAPITKTDQIRLCGNSVCPDQARALLEANHINQVLSEWKVAA